MNRQSNEIWGGSIALYSREKSTAVRRRSSSRSKQMFLWAMKVFSVLQAQAFVSHHRHHENQHLPQIQFQNTNKKRPLNQLWRIRRWNTRDNNNAASGGSDSLSNTPSRITTKLKSISPEMINTIKSYADILTVIESYHLPQFSSDGSRGKCICPFHDDNNPSLQIDKVKGIYKCFSCGAGGDVFNFIREYDHVQRGGEKMSYPAAIVKVATEYVGGTIAEEVKNTLSPRGFHSNLTPDQREKMERDHKQRQRLILVNSAAAEFYASSLITSAKAGGARLHLYNRKLPTNLIRTFAIGYAPDAYFNKDKTKWGEGSLVEHLRAKYDFSPQEIIDAGLATVTTQAKIRLKTTPTDSEVTQTIDFSDLMDRFRNRVMVPIFDETGQHVLGFGGRRIESSNVSNLPSTSYTEAKYLNTAETIIFSKKHLLFNLHHAKKALQLVERDRMQGVRGDEKNVAPFNQNKPLPSIIIVEGYFDAITLYGAGLKEVTASMGTALTEEQLKKAIKWMDAPGKVYLCLDNDEAGQLAIERICTASWVWDFIQKNNVDLQICSLPANSKDPAEFIEKNSAGILSSAGSLFRDEVLKNSVCWNEWYITRIASRYDPRDASSFSTICDKISTFLSTYPNAAERTRRAYDVAGQLAALITKDSSRRDGPLRLQLESDLLSMSSRKAAAREALARRIESVDGNNNTVKQKVRSLSSGEELNLSNSGRVVETSPLKNGIEPGEKSKGDRKVTDYLQSRNARVPEVRRPIGKLSNQQNKKPILTPHFAGFRFSKSDAEWLGITNDSNQNQMLISKPGGKGKKKELVYFNSNQYLGNDAKALRMISSGYNINPLLAPNANRQLIEAEYRLLYVMVHFASARKAMKAVLTNKFGDSMLLEWSNRDREWLFQCLTDSPGHDPIPSDIQESCSVSQLKDHLKRRPDTPISAFEDTVSQEDRGLVNDVPFHDVVDVEPIPKSNPVVPFESDLRFETDGIVFDDEDVPRKKVEWIKNEESLLPEDKKVKHFTGGTLDVFFSDHEEFLKLDLVADSASREERAELTVQESVAFMLRALAMKRQEQLKNEWLNVEKLRKMKESQEMGSESNSNYDEYTHLNHAQVVELCNSIGQKFLHESRTVRDLTHSIQQLQDRLVGYCSSESLEGRNSEITQKELSKALDEYLQNLPPDPRPMKGGYSQDYIFGSDLYDPGIDEKYGGKRRETIGKDSDDIKGLNDSTYDSIFE